VVDVEYAAVCVHSLLPAGLFASQTVNATMVFANIMTVNNSFLCAFHTQITMSIVFCHNDKILKQLHKGIFDNCTC